MTGAAAGLCGAWPRNRCVKKFSSRLAGPCPELLPACPTARRSLEVQRGHGLAQCPEGPRLLLGEVWGRSGQDPASETPGTPCRGQPLGLYWIPRQACCLPRTALPDPALPPGPSEKGLVTEGAVSVLQLSGNDACLMGKPCPHLSAQHSQGRQAPLSGFQVRTQET